MNIQKLQRIFEKDAYTELLCAVDDTLRPRRAGGLETELYASIAETSGVYPPPGQPYPPGPLGGEAAYPPGQPGGAPPYPTGQPGGVPPYPPQ